MRENTVFAFSTVVKPEAASSCSVVEGVLPVFETAAGGARVSVTRPVRSTSTSVSAPDKVWRSKAYCNSRRARGRMPQRGKMQSCDQGVSMHAFVHVRGSVEKAVPCMARGAACHAVCLRTYLHQEANTVPPVQAPPQSSGRSCRGGPRRWVPPAAKRNNTSQGG